MMKELAINIGHSYTIPWELQITENLTLLINTLTSPSEANVSYLVITADDLLL